MNTASILLRIFRWKAVSSKDALPSKAIIVMAPHTSNWDFVWGRLGLSSMGVRNVKFLIKKEAFFFPLGPVLKALGGLPVDRNKSVPVVVQVCKMFQAHDKMILVVTPEGTRKYNKNWKKGFFTIAREAGVPILLAYLDYKSKTGGIGPCFNKPENYEEIHTVMQDFYKDKQAKFPQNFSLSAMYFKK